MNLHIQHKPEKSNASVMPCHGINPFLQGQVRLKQTTITTGVKEHLMPVVSKQNTEIIALIECEKVPHDEKLARNLKLVLEQDQYDVIDESCIKRILLTQVIRDTPFD